MAFAAVTILIDTLHQNFLQPTPGFALRNKRKVKLLYNNLCSLQTSFEQDFKVGEYDEAKKGLEAQLRDAFVELRFQIEHQLTLFYLGRAMKVRLESAKKLLSILNRAMEDTESMSFNSLFDTVVKHFTLPVSRMPAHIKKRVKSLLNEDDMRYMLLKAKSLITQELRASYLKKYMKQRIEARRRIRKIFTLGTKLTGYNKKEMLKVKNAYDESKNTKMNNTDSLGGLERRNITVGDPLQHTSKSTIKLVGCDDEFNTIMDKLNQRSLKRDIVSIVGMGGIGKTILARRIYEDASFISSFDCQAWVTISQEYNPRQVFQDLLHSLDVWTDEIDEASNYELVELVYRCLKYQRYLIVVDDIWSTAVWDELMRCFQDDNNGSRILLTTRHKNVAEYAGSGNSNFCHEKLFLGSNESWNLFQNKVLSERITFSPEFEIIARKIVEKCKGLPLAIIVAAGLLSISKQAFDEWESIAKNVSILSLDHSDQQRENILNLSFTILPHRLKLCFLSFGIFPKDYEVPEYMIVDFWVSEGFLKVVRSKSFEDIARESIQDLVDRHLVQICSEANSYQMHDVLHELAWREGQKENLLRFKEDYAICLRRRRFRPIKFSHKSQQQSIQSRICSQCCLNHFSNFSSYFWLRDFLPVKFLSRLVDAHFKFLRVLIVEKISLNDPSIFMEIMGLVHLRCLTFSTSLNIHSLPLFMLLNLQKLEVFNSSITSEPVYIWGLHQLRYLYFDQGIKLVPPRSVQYNLETINWLDYRSCTKELFMRVPNLRTLVVCDAEIYPTDKESNWFESLVCLHKLQDLSVFGKILHCGFRTVHSMGMLSLESFLPNLQRLLLLGTELKWKDMDVIGTLPMLKFLQLKDAVDGPNWEPIDGGFRQLKFLYIRSSDLQCWEATNDHFPVLECLALQCMMLEDIPSDFAYIITLQSIKLYKCSKSVISSAEHIREEQEEIGNFSFVVDTEWVDDEWS